jgi:hypothetical protein
MNKGTTALVILILLIVAVVAGPLATIWALNTLFPVLAIPYTIETWLAVIVMGGLFKANVTTK